MLRNPHLQTVFPTLARRIPPAPYRRERIATDDGDFLDLDWCARGRRRLAILSHGLEGDSDRIYIRGMTRALVREGWDILAWNFRSCSGEPNRLLRFYHSGAWEDLARVVAHAIQRDATRDIALVGFSVGGNLTLLYLGRLGSAAPSQVRAAVALSVPCDLASSAARLARPANRLYMAYFLRSLRAKIRAKMAIRPGELDDKGFESIRTFADFDARYTAPLNGFAGAADYWRRSSSRPLLPGIARPTLLINAADDPFLAPACYPLAEARANPALTLEVPAHGGHVGFVDFNPQGRYWSEWRTCRFLERCWG
jgi:hypothetical protein